MVQHKHLILKYMHMICGEARISEWAPWGVDSTLEDFTGAMTDGKIEQ